MPDVPTDVVVDLGRSHVRVVGTTERTRPAGAGLVDAGGPAAAARLVADAVRAAGYAAPWRLAVCAPGVVTAPDAAQEFADHLAGCFPNAPERVLVVSDSAAWQAGAFAGGDGAAVALGTGAVVVARHAGTVVRLDGRGLLLGDVGGGAWIGLHALRAATPGSVLHAAAVDRFGPPGTWPGLLGAPDLAARLAAFVPDVVAASVADAAAARVLDDAAAGVAATLAPLPADLPVCLVGGLAPVLGDRLRAVCPRIWTSPVGDAVAGLRALLDDAGPFAAEAVTGRPGALGTAHDTDTLPTEATAPDTEDLDLWPTERLVARLAAGHAVAPRAVLDAVPALTRAADLAGAALAGHGRLVYVGAGTPGRLAVQDAAELTPTFSLDPSRAIVLLAGGPDAGAKAIEGAEDDEVAGRRDVDSAGIGAADVVVGIAASGRTPYVLAALRRARELGAATVGICNVPDSPLAEVAQVTAELLTGPEVIAGSTRLAAGTAQKIALNTLSTAAMVRAGATFGPYMVDMVASNEKLRRRAVRMVRAATGADEATATATLTAADRSVQVAIVMLLADVDADTARARLAAGSVRAALAEPRVSSCG